MKRRGVLPPADPTLELCGIILGLFALGLGLGLKPYQRVDVFDHDSERPAFTGGAPERQIAQGGVSVTPSGKRLKIKQHFSPAFIAGDTNDVVAVHVVADGRQEAVFKPVGRRVQCKNSPAPGLRRGTFKVIIR